jgi:hypothetical protein
MYFLYFWNEFEKCNKKFKVFDKSFFGYIGTKEESKSNYFRDLEPKPVRIQPKPESKSKPNHSELEKS